jgi:hypothetical protein
MDRITYEVIISLFDPLPVAPNAPKMRPIKINVEPIPFNLPASVLLPPRKRIKTEHTGLHTLAKVSSFKKPIALCKRTFCKQAKQAGGLCADHFSLMKKNQCVFATCEFYKGTEGDYCARHSASFRAIIRKQC